MFFRRPKFLARSTSSVAVASGTSVVLVQSSTAILQGVSGFFYPALRSSCVASVIVGEKKKIFLKQLQAFPAIFTWTHSVYGSHPWLFFGNNIIPSAQGVQQGDPLGPFLFCNYFTSCYTVLADAKHFSSAACSASCHADYKVSLFH